MSTTCIPQDSKAGMALIILKTCKALKYQVAAIKAKARTKTDQFFFFFVVFFIDCPFFATLQKFTNLSSTCVDVCHKIIDSLDLAAHLAIPVVDGILKNKTVSVEVLGCRRPSLGLPERKSWPKRKKMHWCTGFLQSNHNYCTIIAHFASISVSPPSF